jgi:lysophospholipase L1-like esterase
MLNPNFELEQFLMMHNMFQRFMKDKDFKNLYFLKAGDYGPIKHNGELIDFYKDNYIPAYDAFLNHLPNDKFHMNQQGHQLLADFVYSKLSI